MGHSFPLSKFMRAEALPIQLIMIVTLAGTMVLSVSMVGIGGLRQSHWNQ
jgi:hypothetical protein